MKKFFIGILVVAIALCFTSCSDELIAQIGGFMNSMSENVYGIEPDMTAVSEASEKVSSSVTVEAGVATIDLDKAAQVMDSIGTISSAPQKAEELKTQLSQPVASNDEDAAAVKTALSDTIDDMSSTVAAIDTSGLTDTQKDIVSAISEALTSAKEGLSDSPTGAEVATVAVMNSLATLADDIAKNPGLIETDPIGVAEDALLALDTLKVVSEVAGMNLLEGIDITTIMSMANGGSEDPKAAGDEYLDYIKMFSTAAKKLTVMVTENGQFSETKYKSVVAQARAIRTSYEFTALPYIPKDAVALADLEPITAKKIDMKLTLDDLIRYAQCVVITELAKIDGWSTDLAGFVNANYACLIDLVHKGGDITAPSDAMAEKMETAVNNFLDASKSLNAIGTAAVIIVDAEWLQTLYNFTGAESFSEFISSFDAK